MTNVFFPGSVVGVLGGGLDSFQMTLQLKQMGYQVAVFSEISNSPAITLADYRFTGKITDRNRLDPFATVSDVIILENSYINPFAAQYLAEHYYVPQGSNLLSLSQDHYLNSLFLNDLNLNTVPNATAVSFDDLVMQTESIGFPLILKPIQKLPRKQYYVLNDLDDLNQVADLIQNFSFFVEAKIEIEAEFGLVVFKSRSQNVEINVLPVVRNFYDEHFELQTSISNLGNVSQADLMEMKRIATGIANKEAFMGAISVEFYKAKNGMLYVKSVSEGLRKFGNLYRIMIGKSQEELYLKANLGLPIPPIKNFGNGINVYFKQARLDDIYTQLIIKPDWDFVFYPSRWKNPLDTAGYLTIKGDNFTEIYERLSNTDIWNLPQELFES
ncbi:ATP-grasp domain-containing protein [Xylocopilactobacillus apicola]|uniref:Phosphoribosylglycinamide formyltransferase 2 n=1 Tax=Xylocopilactobacillus apicola TaxID=2932184 RepID=A0AAU9D4M5_9LACO|nr:ATP-grasp domain-containing protein [Xylocopilactobacillus apicola]BDR58453.1 phosphoribosylglycinamide formyltransferase 2 [Xylocopilactobacillus apicola]